MKRRSILVLALGVVLFGCGSGIPAPLRVDAEFSDANCCLLSFSVMDVAADPELGTVDASDGSPLTWPRGYTARWVGMEIEVVDASGSVVLRTGHRYWFSPLYPPYDKFIIGEVRQCDGCELGGGPL